MPPASRVGGSDTSTRSRATDTVTRPDSCCTRKGTVSLASNTTRASSPETNVLTCTLGIETGPMTRTRWATPPLDRPLEERRRGAAAGRRRARASVPPRASTGDERSFRSPSTEARLFLWCSTSSWLPRRTLTAPPGASLVSVAPRPASTSSIATSSPSARIDRRDLAPLRRGQDRDRPARRRGERGGEGEEAREGAAEGERGHSAVEALQQGQSKGTPLAAARRSTITASNPAFPRFEHDEEGAA